MPRLTCLLVVVVLLPATPARSQTAAIPPGESLVTDGIPPIPASIAEAARRYSEFRTAAFWDWHPTRREMLIGTRFGDAQQLHLVKIPGGARTQLTFFPDPVSGASYQPTDGRYVVFSKDVGGGEFFQKYRYDVATGDITLLSDGKGMYLTTDLGSEVRRLAYLSLLGKRYRFLSDRLPWDVDEFALSPDGRWIAFVANEDGIGALHVINAATGAERRIPKLPAGLIGNVTWRRTGAELAFSFTSARSGEDAYSLDLVTGRLVRWTESETGGLNTADFAEPELIHWSSFDGRSVSGFLYKPPVRFAGRRPVIINIHGGPEGESRPGFLGRSNYYVNELGIALILPNVRGSTGHGKTFVKLDNGTLREGAYKDIGALFDWIRARPDLDPDHVLVTGGSYGGHMTLVTARLYNDRVCCSVDVVGISNLATFLKNTSGYRQDLRRVEYGDERDSTTRAWMERAAPLNNVAKVTKPLFIVQGMNDPRVPRSEAEQMVAALKQRNVPVWHPMAKDQGGGFRKKSNQDFQFYATILFTQRYLLGQGAPASAP